MHRVAEIVRDDAEDFLTRTRCELGFVSLLSLGVEASRAMQRVGRDLGEKKSERFIGCADGPKVAEADADRTNELFSVVAGSLKKKRRHDIEVE